MYQHQVGQGAASASKLSSAEPSQLVTVQNSIQKGQNNMMTQSSKQLGGGRDSSNRSTTPQKGPGAMLKKPGVQYDNYQMAAGPQGQLAAGKQMHSHQMLAKPGQGPAAANF